MTALDVLTQLQPIFRDVFDNPSLRVTPEDSAASVEGWDSLSHISLISSIEKQFKIRFALAELQEAKNVGDMVGLVLEKLQDHD